MLINYSGLYLIDSFYILKETLYHETKSDSYEVYSDALTDFPSNLNQISVPSIIHNDTNFAPEINYNDIESFKLMNLIVLFYILEKVLIIVKQF